MFLLLLAYLGGALTIVSPCILPVLPFVFSRTGEPFTRSLLPMLAGLVLSFAAVGSLAAVGGGWVVTANQYGRWIALALMVVFALAMLWPGLADRLSRPFVAAGSRLSEKAQAGGGQSRPRTSFLIGIATGLLWAPCAGPILGLILAGAALQGPGVQSTMLLIAYAAGAATSMAAALLLGGRVLGALKRSLGSGEWLRRGLGAAMLVAVVAIMLGLDTGLLARLSVASTGGIEQTLVDRLAGRPGGSATEPNPPTLMAAGDGVRSNAHDARSAQHANAAMAPVANAAPVTNPAPVANAAPAAPPNRPASTLPDEGPAPPLNGATQWLQSPPLDGNALRGKVVLIDFWTYSCINCLRSLPYVKAWEQKYRDQGFVVVGVHTPEFAFERDVGNVTKAMKNLGITYPVAIDNQYAIWRAFRNQYWPAHYLIDAQGHVRFHHFGEGQYAETERAIQQLLQEAGATAVEQQTTQVQASGIEQPSDLRTVRSPETYVGYARSENFASRPATVPDRPTEYTAPKRLATNAWGLGGRWTVGDEHATLVGHSGRIVFRFHARDLHLVLGPGPDGRPVKFRVLLDGKPPAQAHGTDVAPDGTGTVTEQRLYQLVRQPGDIVDRTFSIEFDSPGVRAYAFTFG